MNTKSDSNLFDTLNLEELVRDHASEPAFAFAPLGFRGPLALGLIRLPPASESLSVVVTNQRLRAQMQ